MKLEGGSNASIVDSEGAGADSVEWWRAYLQDQGIRCGEVWLTLLAHVKVDRDCRLLQWTDYLTSSLHILIAMCECMPFVRMQIVFIQPCPSFNSPSFHVKR